MYRVVGLYKKNNFVVATSTIRDGPDEPGGMPVKFISHQESNIRDALQKLVTDGDWDVLSAIHQTIFVINKQTQKQTTFNNFYKLTENHDETKPRIVIITKEDVAQVQVPTSRLYAREYMRDVLPGDPPRQHVFERQDFDTVSEYLYWRSCNIIKTSEDTTTESTIDINRYQNNKSPMYEPRHAKKFIFNEPERYLQEPPQARTFLPTAREEYLHDSGFLDEDVGVSELWDD